MAESGFSLVLELEAAAADEAAVAVRLTVPSDFVVLLATTLALVLPVRVAVLLTDVVEDDTLREDVVVVEAERKTKKKRAATKKKAKNT